MAKNIPAFPVPSNWSGEYSEDCDGMTLRDWFAGLSLVECYSIAYTMHDGPDEQSMIAAKLAYRLADAMIEERQKGGTA